MKPWSSILTVFALLPVLAGCSQDASEPEDSDRSSAESDDSSDESEEDDSSDQTSAQTDASGTRRDASGQSNSARDDGGMSTPEIDGGASGRRDAATADAADSAARDSGAGSGVAATFETLQTIITQAPCFGAGCHNDDQNPLDLRVDDALYTRLTSGSSMNCGDLPIVNPGEPEESALVKILEEPCGETQRMPPGCVEDGDGACIPPEYIAAIKQWIAMGAPED